MERRRGEGPRRPTGQCANSAAHVAPSVAPPPPLVTSESSRRAHGSRNVSGALALGGLKIICTRGMAYHVSEMNMVKAMPRKPPYSDDSPQAGLLGISAHDCVK